MTPTFIFWLVVIVGGGLLFTGNIGVLWVVLMFILRIVWVVVSFPFALLYGATAGRSEALKIQKIEEEAMRIGAERKAAEEKYYADLQDFTRYPLPFPLVRGVADRLAGSSVKVSLQK